MYRLLRKGVPFEWSKECDENLHKMKNAVKNRITVAVPDLHDRDQSYHLVIDGSNKECVLTSHRSSTVNGESSDTSQKPYPTTRQSGDKPNWNF